MDSRSFVNKMKIKRRSRLIPILVLAVAQLCIDSVFAKKRKKEIAELKSALRTIKL